MSEAALLPKSYLIRFFQVQYNWILFGGALLFSLASASPLPALVGLALEALWLLVGSNVPALRRWVDRRDSRERRAATDEAVKSALGALGPGYAERVAALDAAVGEIHELGDAGADGELARFGERLDELRPGFVRLCQVHRRLSRFLAETPGGALEQEIGELERNFAEEQDLGVRFALRQARTLAQRRLEQRERLVGTFKAVELKLGTVEKSVAYIRSQGLTLGLSRELALELESVLAQVGSVAALEAEGEEGVEKMAFSAAESAPRA